MDHKHGQGNWEAKLLKFSQAPIESKRRLIDFRLMGSNVQMTFSFLFLFLTIKIVKTLPPVSKTLR